MAHLVSAASAAEAWQQGAGLILNTPSKSVNNLITEITDGTAFDPDWLSRYNPQAVGAVDSLSVVAKVLFPDRLRSANEERAEYYSRWTQLLTRSRNSGRLRSAWNSTYFERLMSLGGSPNQVERAIRALTTWPQRYEAAIVMHTSSPLNDGLRTRGSPAFSSSKLFGTPMAFSTSLPSIEAMTF